MTEYSDGGDMEEAWKEDAEKEGMMKIYVIYLKTFETF